MLAMGNRGIGIGIRPRGISLCTALLNGSVCAYTCTCTYISVEESKIEDGLRWASVLIVGTPWTRNGAIASGRGRITDIICGSFGLGTTKND